MKRALLSAMMLVGLVSTYAYAEEPIADKVSDSAATAKRHVKKSAHRAGEAMCTEGDVKCAGKKAGHRIEEGTDATVDKAKEIKHKNE